MEKILITGSSGFIGQAVREALANDYEVVPLPGRLHEIQQHSIDVDGVVHIAGALRHRPEAFYAANALGTQQLLAGLCKPTPVVYISSRGVYQVNDTPLTEDSPVGPEDPYGQTKLLGEKAVAGSGNPYLILRPTAVFGKSINSLGVTYVDQTLRRMVRHTPVSLYTPDRLHDYLYVHDLANIIRALLNKPVQWNQVFNISGIPGSLHDFIRLAGDLVAARMGFNPEIEVIPGPPPRAPIMKHDKLLQAFPDTSFTAPALVFQEMIEWVIQEEN